MFFPKTIQLKSYREASFPVVLNLTKLGGLSSLWFSQNLEEEYMDKLEVNNLPELKPVEGKVIASSMLNETIPFYKF